MLMNLNFLAHPLSRWCLEREPWARSCGISSECLFNQLSSAV